MRQTSLACFTALAFAVVAGPAAAHEFWIEPTDYTVPPEAQIEAFIVNGQAFGGNTIAFFPDRIARFSLTLGEDDVPVTARLGDNPALRQAPLGEGLHVAIYQSTGDLLTYDSYAVFARFVEHKDFPGWIHHQHRDRGLPETGFREFYTRYCKSLIAVGTGAGEDRALGLEIELVALENPYTGDMSDGVTVQALYQGAPRVNEQIELFDKAADGTVTTTYHRTDDQGIAVLPVTPGHSYLVDTVALRVPSDEMAAATGAVWESVWASLTFAVPE